MMIDEQDPLFVSSEVKIELEADEHFLFRNEMILLDSRPLQIEVQAAHDDMENQEVDVDPLAGQENVNSSSCKRNTHLQPPGEAKSPVKRVSTRKRQARVPFEVQNVKKAKEIKKTVTDIPDTINKDNTPTPETTVHPSPVRERKKRANLTGKTKNYSTDILLEALLELKAGKLTLGAASKKYNIPKTTLHDKLHNVTAIDCNYGPEPLVPLSVQAKLRYLLIEITNRGFHLSNGNFCKIAIEFLNKTGYINRFKNKTPGSTWVRAFLKKHPDVKCHVKSYHAVSLTREKIQNWFEDLHTYLININCNNLLEDPSRVWILDERVFLLSSPVNTSDLILVKKRDTSNNIKDQKEHNTVVLAASASGKIGPEMIMNSETSKTKWMDSDIFKKYLLKLKEYLIEESILNCENNSKKILLLISGSVCILSLETIKMCEEMGIVVYYLHSNATTILNPFNNGIINSLRIIWNKILNDHSTNNGKAKIKQAKPITNSEFPKLIRKALNEVTSKVIKESFHSSGLYPFNISNTTYLKLPENIHKKSQPKYTLTVNEILAKRNQSNDLELPENIPEKNKATVNETKAKRNDKNDEIYFKIFESKIIEYNSENTLKLFRLCFELNMKWPSDSYFGLYMIWKKWQAKVYYIPESNILRQELFDVMKGLNGFYDKPEVNEDNEETNQSNEFEDIEALLDEAFIGNDIEEHCISDASSYE